MEDLSKQLRDLQAEFDLNSAATRELEEALHKTKQINEELETKLTSQSKENEKAQQNIKELESQVQELNTAKEEAGKKVEEMLEDNRKYLSWGEMYRVSQW